MRIADKAKLPPGLPNNVKVVSWVPQISLLAHPNTKIFITHGGLGGLQEALYHGVPMIGMPLFGDQFRNCRVFVAKKMMVEINFKELSGKILDSALEKIIRNPIYKEKAVYYSKLFRDQPISRMDNAIFWIGYVIRNGKVLKPPAHDYNWWQLALFDIYALILLVIILTFAMIFMGVKIIVKILLKILMKNVNSSENTMLKKKI